MGESSAPPRIIVLDGHDGSGKTTLARMAAESLDGTYAKPFDGTLGDMIMWLSDERRYELADQLARASIEKIMKEHHASPLPIFDRHWLSMFTLFPAELRDSWYPLPATILCWTDLETTKLRLSTRGEELGDGAEHERYIRLYRALAKSFDLPIIDTSTESPGASLDRIVELVRVSCFESGATQQDAAPLS